MLVCFGSTEHGHSGELRLVSDERSELPERPVVQAGSPCASGRNPSANMPQSLQGNSTPGALRGLDERLRDTVVAVPLEPPLSAGELAKSPLGRLGADD